MNESSITPQPVQHGWSKDTLLAKASRYAAEMWASPVDDWHHLLWSSFTLELLARACLANTSPVLLADHSNWNNLLYALGQNSKESKFTPRSVGVATVFSRIRDLHAEFTPELEGFSAGHMARRNEDLHDGNITFDPTNTSWRANYFRACKVILEAMDETLEDFFGSDQVQNIESLISAATDESAKAVKKLVNAHQTIWEQKTEEERAVAVASSTAWASRQTGHRVDCPACNSPSLISGVGVGTPIKAIDEDQIVESQEFQPVSFECIGCGLKIGGLSQLTACGLGDSYTSTTYYDAGEYYLEQAGWVGYEPDFNE